MEKITQQELKNVIDTKRRGCVLDARTLKEYLDFRIKNKAFVPLELLDHIQQPELRWNKSKPIYVISYTEARSKAFCHKLEALGYRTFYLEEGEVEAWCRKHLPVIDTLKSCQDTNNFRIIISPIKAIGHYFRSIICVAWLFEKMNCNIKFAFARGFNYFENSTFEVSQEFSSNSYTDLRLKNVNFHYYYFWVPLDYACSVISKLTINKEIQDEADEWVRVNLKGDWVGVHYRGTDMTLPKYGYTKMDTYISHLKKVIDKNHDIFVCSDQAQFIDRINKAFPGRVFSRSIQRSHDNKGLHNDVNYKGLQQRKNALIDILVLSKANLIYKTVGNFSTTAFFFNPSINMISFVSENTRCKKCVPEKFVRIS